MGRSQACCPPALCLSLQTARLGSCSTSARVALTLCHPLCVCSGHVRSHVDFRPAASCKPSLGQTPGGLTLSTHAHAHTQHTREHTCSAHIYAQSRAYTVTTHMHTYTRAQHTCVRMHTNPVHTRVHSAHMYTHPTYTCTQHAPSIHT